MFYDTHCHPFLAKEKSQEKVLEDFFSGGGVYLNSIGIDISSSLISLSIAQKYEGAFASIGIHPTSTPDFTGRLERTISRLEDIYKEDKNNIVAIGECGLDYHWLPSLSEKYSISEKELIEVQKDFFIAQIKLAKKLSLPIIIHSREASEDIFDILKRQEFTNFVFHCYSEDYAFSQKILEFAPNCMLGFGGITTFKNALQVQETVQKIPLKNIIIETDSPYLTPAPFRGRQENEPILVKHVLSNIIDLRDEDSQLITNTIMKNSREFFGINNPLKKLDSL